MSQYAYRVRVLYQAVHRLYTKETLHQVFFLLICSCEFHLKALQHNIVIYDTYSLRFGIKIQYNNSAKQGVGKLTPFFSFLTIFSGLVFWDVESLEENRMSTSSEMCIAASVVPSTLLDGIVLGFFAVFSVFLFLDSLESSTTTCGRDPETDPLLPRTSRSSESSSSYIIIYIKNGVHVLFLIQFVCFF